MDCSYKIAETDAERDQCYRMRYQICCFEYKYLDPNKYPDQMEKDAFDNDPARTKNMIAVCGNKVVGSVRLIEDVSGKSLLMEEYADLSAYRRDGKLIEISRLVILPEFRHDHDILFGLIKISIFHSLNIGCRFMCNFSEKERKSKYMKFGMERVGDPFPYNGFIGHPEMVTLIVDIKDFLRNIGRINPRFKRYIEKTNDSFACLPLDGF